MDQCRQHPAILQILQDLEKVLGSPLGLVIISHLWERDSGAILAVFGSPVALDITPGGVNANEHGRRYA